MPAVDIELELNVKLKLSYEAFYDRGLEIAEVFDRYANEGIKFRRRDIIAFLRYAGPTTVAYGGGAKWATVITVGANFAIRSVPGELFIHLADKALKRMGVPN